MSLAARADIDFTFIQLTILLFGVSMHLLKNCMHD